MKIKAIFIQQKKGTLKHKSLPYPVALQKAIPWKRSCRIYKIQLSVE
jgi:hypothetical protein